VKQNGFTIVEIIIVLSVLGVLAAVTIPGLLRTRMRASEASALTALRTIHEAQAAFRATCGNGSDYAASLPQLGAAQTLTRDLSDAAIVAHSGYLITMTASEPGAKPDSCTNGDTATHWYASAVPDASHGPGRRGFATGDGEGIWQDVSGAAPAIPFGPSQNVSEVEVMR